MRRTPLRIVLGAATLAATLPTPSPAAVPHVVQPGETLWTIASASNLTNRALAAYNGLEPEGNVILGSTIRIPTPAEAAAAMARAGMTPVNPPAAGAPAPAAAAPTTPAAAPGAPAAAPAAGSPPPMGAYTVRWGDTLSGLAASARVPLASIAAMNGLDPQRPLLAGTVIKLPTGAPPPPAASRPAPAATVVPAAAPVPAPGRVTAADVRRIAIEHGVPASLAAAIAWQESGFNNQMVSAANARGVMQIMPGTWDWIQSNLAHAPLDPASALDNVHAGVMYLGHLLRSSGGDETAAVAGYYQGLGSVRSRGLFDDTRRYLTSVKALRPRFGGP